MEPKQTDESAPGCGLNSADTWRKARSASVRSVMPGELFWVLRTNHRPYLTLPSPSRCAGRRGNQKGEPEALRRFAGASRVAARVRAAPAIMPHLSIYRRSAGASLRVPISVADISSPPVSAPNHGEPETLKRAEIVLEPTTLYACALK